MSSEHKRLMPDDQTLKYFGEKKLSYRLKITVKKAIDRKSRISYQSSVFGS